MCLISLLYRIRGVMVSVLASSMVDLGSRPVRVNPKTISLLYVASPLSTYHKSKDWSTQNQYGPWGNRYGANMQVTCRKLELVTLKMYPYTFCIHYDLFCEVLSCMVLCMCFVMRYVVNSEYLLKT